MNLLSKNVNYLRALRKSMQTSKMRFSSVLSQNKIDDEANKISYLKEFLEASKYPELPFKVKNYPKEFQSKINLVLAELDASKGAQFDNFGIKTTKKEIANYIENRDDGMISYWQNIFLTNNSIDAIQTVLKVLIETYGSKDKPIGLIYPTPSLKDISTDLEVYQINYNLSPENNFDVNLEELEKAYNESLSLCIPKAILFNSPNDLSGRIYGRKNIENLVRWAHEHDLVVIANEKNQTDVFDGKFDSFKKVSHQMGPPYSDLKLVSTFELDSNKFDLQTSFLESVNMSPQLKSRLDELFRFKTSSILNQLALSLYLNEDKDLDEMRTASDSFYKFLKSIDIEASRVQSGFHVLIKPKLPNKFVDEAKSQKKSPIELYCLELIKATGIIATPLHKLDLNSTKKDILRIEINNNEKFKCSFQNFHLNLIQKWS